MTDLEIYLAMLERAGLSKTARLNGPYCGNAVDIEVIAKHVDDMPAFTDEKPGTEVRVWQTHDEAGYIEFCAVHVFDADGKLIAVGGAE